MLPLSPETFNRVYPISGMDVYESVIVLKRTATIEAKLVPRGKRGKVKELSKSSLTRLAFLVSVSSKSFTSILTLTYLQSPICLTEAKVHLNRFLVRMSRYYGDFSYVWFMEFTRAGLAHFHVLTSLYAPIVSRETFARFWVDSVGAKDWWYCSLRTKRENTVRAAMLSVHRHRKCFEQIRLEDGAKRYALKYALKPYQKQVPNHINLVGRFWGASRDIIGQPLISDVTITEEDLRERLGEEHRLAGAEILPKYIWL